LPRRTAPSTGAAGISPPFTRDRGEKSVTG